MNTKYDTPYKFVGPRLFMYVTAGFLQINACTKPTLCTILQTKFEYISSLKIIVFYVGRSKDLTIL